MVVVSGFMKISITLNKEIKCEYICAQIQELINKVQTTQDISKSVLIIDIVETIDGGDNHIPKLTFDPDCTT